MNVLTSGRLALDAEAVVSKLGATVGTACAGEFDPSNKEAKLVTDAGLAFAATGADVTEPELTGLVFVA
jgi:hypothetical protein